MLADEIAHALAGDGARCRRPVPLGDRADVGLGADDDARAFEQLGPVLRRARAAGSAPARAGDTPSSCGEVEHDAQHAGPLDVAEELVAQPLALAGTLDQAGDVGDDEVGVVVDLARRRGGARGS